MKNTPVDNTGAKVGRSLNPIKSIQNWRKLIKNWHLSNKNKRQDKMPELTFNDWMKKSGFNLDEEVNK